MQSMLSSILRQGNPLSDLNKGLKLYLDGTYDSVNGWFVDKSGNGNHGTPYNGATTGTGVVGDGMAFDGINDYIRVIAPDCLKSETTHSFNIWFRYDGASDSTSYHRITDGFLTLYIIRNGAANTIYARTYDGTTVRSLTFNGICDGNVHMITFVRVSGDKLYGYVDGAYHSETDISMVSTSPDADTYFYLGGVTGGIYSWDGTLDEVRIYDRALTANEVKALYRLKRP